MARVPPAWRLLVFGLCFALRNARGWEDYALKEGNWTRNSTNDDSLGLDWIDSNDASYGLGSRKKRALGTSLEDAQSFLVEVARQAVSADEVDFGDSFTFHFILDLPAIPEESLSDLKIEIFGLHPNSGLGGFHICQSHVLFKGDKIIHLQEHPVYQDVTKDGYANYVEKSVIILEQLHTDNHGSNDDRTKIITQFQAVLLNTPDVLPDEKYFITAGAEFANGAFVWVHQAEITTKFVPTVYDSTVELTVAPTSLRKGDAGLFIVSAYVTHPSVYVEFGVFQPLGYNDIFHFGQVQRTLGNAFACSDEKYWSEKYTRSPTRLSVNNITMSYPMLINREAERDVTQDVNRITFEVPIHVMNVDILGTGIERYISFSMRIGEERVWSAMHEVTILEAEAPPTPGTVSISSVQPVFTDSTVLAGNAAVFLVEVSAPSGWSNFDTIVRGDTTSDVRAVGARVIKSGLVAFFPAEWTVTHTNEVENTVSVNYGSVKNVSPNLPTTVTIELAFATDPELLPTSVSGLSATIGGQNVPLVPFDIAVNSPRANDIDIQLIPRDFNVMFHSGGQIGMEFVVSAPDGSGSQDVSIESVPDLDITGFEPRLCRIKVHDIGKNLPCLYHLNPATEEAYQKSNDSMMYDDIGIINIGQVCPYTQSDAIEEDNQFHVSLFYDLPPDQTIPGGTYFLAAGMKRGTSTVWITSDEYTLDANDFTGAPIESAHPSDLVVPFLSVYPIISTRGREDIPFDNGEGLFAQFIFKTQPLTRGNYDLVIDVPDNVRICKIEMTHIGDNFPCAVFPGISHDHDRENIVFDFGADPHACGEPASIKFQGLTNWGRDAIVPDLTPDANSMQALVYMMVCSDTGWSAATAEIPLRLEYGETGFTVESSLTLKVSNLEKPTSDATQIDDPEVTSLVGEENEIFKSAVKLIRVEVTVPPGYLGNISVEFVNDGFDDGIYIDFYDAALVGQGENIPCLSPESDVFIERSDESVDLGSGIMYKSMRVTAHSVCYFDVLETPEASLLTFEFAIGVREDMPDGTAIPLSLNVYPHSENLVNSQELTFMEAKPLLPGHVTIDTLELGDLKVLPDPSMPSPMPIKTGRKEWVTFFVGIPPETTVLMEASFLLESANKVAIFHASDVRFSPPPGMGNIPGTGPDTDLKGTYETIFEKTELNTFMQSDVVTIDFGVVTNAAFSLKQGIYNETVDDQFAVSIEIQMSDHNDTVDTNLFKVFLAVKVGDFITVASHDVQPDRSDPRSTEVGNLIIEATTEHSSSAMLNSGDKIQVSTVIYHANNSYAEGYPTYLRVFMPNYIVFDNMPETFQTNYTLNTNISPAVGTIPPGQPDASYMDIAFHGGLTYADVVDLNFSLTVDPLASRPPSNGPDKAAIILQPICVQNVINDYPAVDSVAQRCGDFATINISLSPISCHTEVTLGYSCQVRASSMSSDTFRPFNVISTVSVWMPAVRPAAKWEFIEFDFLTLVPLSMLMIGRDTSISSAGFVRVASRVRIEGGMTPKSMAKIGDFDVSLVGDGRIILPTPVAVRYLRLRVLETSFGDPASVPLVMNGVQFFGCLPDNFVPDPSSCFADTTVDSNDISQYRHFAVDDDRDIVYFCDINDFSGAMQCFVSGDDGQWNLLPSHVGRILGYSVKRGRMFLSDASGASVMSSLDGIEVELSSNAVPNDVRSAVVVPGRTEGEIGEVFWTGQLFQYKGTFNGLYKGDQLLARWRPCCST